MSDNAIAILKEIHDKMGKDIPFNLVEQCYETEKKFLFEKDPTKSLVMLKQIVETFIDNESK